MLLWCCDCASCTAAAQFLSSHHKVSVTEKLYLCSSHVIKSIYRETLDYTGVFIFKCPQLVNSTVGRSSMSQILLKIVVQSVNLINKASYDIILENILYVLTYVCCICIHIYFYVHTYIHMHICMYVCVYVHIHM